VARGSEKQICQLVPELLETLDNRDLGTAQLVILDRIDKEPLEGCLEIGKQIGVLLVANDRRRRGDDQI
jgi:hypothetical protein